MHGEPHPMGLVIEIPIHLVHGRADVVGVKIQGADPMGAAKIQKLLLVLGLKKQAGIPHPGGAERPGWLSRRRRRGSQQETAENK